MATEQNHLFEFTEFKLIRVLADAVDKKLLPESSVEIVSYNQHLDAEQQQFSVQTETGDYFIKRQPALNDGLKQFAAEQQSLRHILDSGTFDAVTPIACGVIDDYAYSILDHIPISVHGDWQQAGQQLAELHDVQSTQGFGFPITTFCGKTLQNNTWRNDWASFFTEQRLSPILDALSNDHPVIAEQLPNQQKLLQLCHQYLDGHQPKASLLHGDLWSGNIGFKPTDDKTSKPIIFDPACYYGDAETDIAMTELFGRFPSSFYQGYQTHQPMSEEYKQRRPVYQLYHLLNHTRIFGKHYLPQTLTLIKQLHH